MLLWKLHWDIYINYNKDTVFGHHYLRLEAGTNYVFIDMQLCLAYTKAVYMGTEYIMQNVHGADDRANTCSDVDYFVVLYKV